MNKIRILFEAGPMLDSKKTGVGYYTDHLIKSLHTSYANKLDLSGYYFNFLHRNKEKSPKNSPITFYEIRLIPGKLLSLCRRLKFQPVLELFIRKRADIVLFTNFVSLPLLNRRPKVVLTVYDVSFLDVPEYTQSINLKFMQRFSPPSIRRADAIITISEFTKDRLKHYFPDLKVPIVVTPVPPADQPAAPGKLPVRLTQMGIAEKRYILYVSTIEPRKNLEALVRAYAAMVQATRDKYALVLAGGKGWKDDAILKTIDELKASGMQIIMAGYVSNEEKSALYSYAACFVMPSHYEGFGMPILEAMQYHIPTAVSDIPVFHEVAGDGAVYFDKDSEQDIADKLAGILDDAAATKALVARAHAQLQTFSWEANAAKVFALFQDISS